IATTNADGPEQLDVKLGVTTSYAGLPTIAFERQCTESFKYSQPLAHWLDRHAADFDLVHIHAVFSHPCWAAARACRQRGVPYVVRPLGTLDPWSLGQKRFKKQVIWRFGVRAMLAGASAIHYTTEAE